MLEPLDTFLTFYTQLEARDKINKVFQNFFRALAGLSDETAIKILSIIGNTDCSINLKSILGLNKDIKLGQWCIGSLSLIPGPLSQSQSDHSGSNSDSSDSESDLKRAQLWKRVMFRLGRAFEDARVMGWIGKCPNDFRSIYKQLPSLLVSSGPGQIVVDPSKSCTTLINGGSVWSDDPSVRFLLTISRVVMAIRWGLENVRLGGRIRDWWWEMKESKEKEDGKENEEKKKPIEPSINVFAKQFWVANCTFAFAAEFLRIIKFLTTSSTDLASRQRLGGSLKSSLIALWFYFADIHASSNLCGYRKDSELRIGTMMTLAALTQLYNMYPTAGDRYKLASSGISV